jgi:hypothetical protein
MFRPATLSLLLVGLTACSPSEKSPPKAVDNAPPPVAAVSAKPKAIALPGPALAALRADFKAGATDARYFAQAVDLNGDGKNEIVVHVAGPMVCGTGGCNTVVLTPDGDKYRIVADISVNSPPIRAAATSSHGWRDLIVEVGGGGGPSGPVLLRFDGNKYPDDPSDTPAERLPAAPPDAQTLVAPFDSFAQGTLLYDEGQSGAPAG